MGKDFPVTIQQILDGIVRVFEEDWNFVNFSKSGKSVNCDVNKREVNYLFKIMKKIKKKGIHQFVDF